ncbi:MAG: Rpn family recombination-promoting nuclease/putative transposase, partial [Candidatus Competibacter denitrificans]
MTYDPAYKKLFSQPRLIEDLLKGFVPQPWVAELDFSTLEKRNVHFVTPQLGWRQSDVIWRVKLRDHWLYVLILLEFQSSIDRWMPLRLWVYLGLLYLELLEQQQLLPNGKLPPVLPIVLYNGAPRWRASTQLADLLETLPGLAPYQPRFEF